MAPRTRPFGSGHLGYDPLTTTSSPALQQQMRPRSHSYDESFLHRRPVDEFDVLEPPSLSSHRQRRPAEAPEQGEQPPLLRTNFGKSRVYRPPPVTNTGEWTSFNSDYHRVRRDRSVDDASIPFDQQRSELDRHARIPLESSSPNRSRRSEQQHSSSDNAFDLRIATPSQRDARNQSGDDSSERHALPTRYLFDGGMNTQPQRQSLTDYEPNSPKQRSTRQQQQDYGKRFQIPPFRIPEPAAPMTAQHAQHQHSYNNHMSSSSGLDPRETSTDYSHGASIRPGYYTTTDTSMPDNSSSSFLDTSLGAPSPPRQEYHDRSMNILDTSYENFVVPTDNESDHHQHGAARNKNKNSSRFGDRRDDDDDDDVPVEDIDDDSLFDFDGQYQQLHGSKKSPTRTNNRSSSARRSRRDNDYHSRDGIHNHRHYDSDSGAASSSRRRRGARAGGAYDRRRMRRGDEEEEEDDTSLEYGEQQQQQRPSPRRDKSLERSYAAWKRKTAQQQQQQRNSTSPGRQQAAAKPASSQNSVSFGRDNTVKYYEPEQDDGDTNTNTQLTADADGELDGRSLNSFYTKSAESEVEDIIKDILLIGSGTSSNPGRRQIKHRPQVKRSLRERMDGLLDDDEQQRPQQEETEDDTTLTMDVLNALEDEDTTTMDGGTTVTDLTSTVARRPPSPSRNNSNDERKAPSSPSRSKSSTDKQQEETAAAAAAAGSSDPFSEVWGFFFGSDDNGASSSKAKCADNRIDCAPRGGALCNRDGGDPPTIGCSNSADASVGGGGGTPATAGGFEGFLNYASDLVLGSVPYPKESEDDDDGQEEDTSKKDVARGKDRAAASSPSRSKTKRAVAAGATSTNRAPDPDSGHVALEEDLRLVELAVQAARCMHRIRGCEFDDSYKIDISSDIMFSVVDLEMPLGLIFQENEIGCWVTKVLASGSASRNGKVQVGDQLAAIDGVSAINMKVHQMAEMITSKTADVELTFLRYVGRLHAVPSTVLEEGYEVPAKTVSSAATKKRQDTTPPKKKGPGLQSNRSPRGVNNLHLTIADEKKESEEAPLPRTPTPTKNRGGEKRRFRLFGKRKKGAK